MTNLLRKTNSKNIVKEKEMRYKVYNFTQNPFPNSPGITINGDDKRENGSIYLKDLRVEEEKLFEKFLIPKLNSAETKKIAFLMDYATKKGRGIGKTAFLNYQRHRIMNDLGEELSEGTQVIFAAYISPIPGNNYNHFWKISKLLLQSLIQQDVVSLAMCRIRAFYGKIPEEILDKVDDNLIETIGDDDWLINNGFLYGNMEDYVKKQLLEIGLNEDLVNMLIDFGTDSSKFLSRYFNSLKDSFWRNEGNALLFNDFVKLFKLAGFDKGIILFDELEKVFPPLNKLERRTFVDSIRYFFIDGAMENTRELFFELLLTIHPYLQELMIPHWEAAGMGRFAALGGEQAQNYTIYFKPIKDDLAIPLAKEYMNESRNSGSQEKLITPFTEDALRVASTLSNNIPGNYLTFLHSVIEKSIEKKWNIITANEINIIAKEVEPEEPEANDEKKPLEEPAIILK